MGLWSLRYGAVHATVPQQAGVCHRCYVHPSSSGRCSTPTCCVAASPSRWSSKLISPAVSRPDRLKVSFLLNILKRELSRSIAACGYYTRCKTSMSKACPAKSSMYTELVQIHSVHHNGFFTKHSMRETDMLHTGSVVYNWLMPA
jgi:hypothetical protein